MSGAFTDDDMDHIGLDAAPAPDEMPRRRESARRSRQGPIPQRDSARGSRYTLTGGASTAPATKPPALNKDHVSQLLEQGFSRGLARALAYNANAFDHRIWVVDNSGSMQIGDGHRIVEIDNKVVAQPVTRWEEIQDTVLYHSQMAAVLDSPTVFRLLNDPGGKVGIQEFSVARGSGDAEADIRAARRIMLAAKPIGVTPLTEHIWTIQTNIVQMEPTLKRKGQRVAVILATDGLPTDEQGYGGDEVIEEFVRALQSLEGLPIWLVIRLCTDEAKVTEFYNQLDNKLELNLEVLDDFMGEAREVQKVNKWLNYALPMHRCRELGYHDRLFDLIDERALTKWELREFVKLLFGIDDDGAIPDPATEWKEFMTFVQDQLKYERLQWDPVKKKMAPWIHLKALHKAYGKGKCEIM